MYTRTRVLGVGELKKEDERKIVFFFFYHVDYAIRFGESIVEIPAATVFRVCAVRRTDIPKTDAGGQARPSKRFHI